MTFSVTPAAAPSADPAVAAVAAATQAEQPRRVSDRLPPWKLSAGGFDGELGAAFAGPLVESGKLRMAA